MYALADTLNHRCHSRFAAGRASKDDTTSIVRFPPPSLQTVVVFSSDASRHIRQFAPCGTGAPASARQICARRPQVCLVSVQIERGRRDLIEPVVRFANHQRQKSFGQPPLESLARCSFQHSMNTRRKRSNRARPRVDQRRVGRRYSSRADLGSLPKKIGLLTRFRERLRSPWPHGKAVTRLSVSFRNYRLLYT